MGNRGMVSLVKFLGDERIRFQVVHQTIDGNISLTKQGETRFTLVTDQANLVPGDILKDKPRKYGILMWIDAADYEAWLAAKL